MNSEDLDGKIFQAALEETVEKLHEKREILNQINVFPVPDGDTGNNMLATLESAFHETKNITSGSLHDVAAAAYRGAREGSTGNSGAIFAQYLKGWAAAFTNLETAGAMQLSEAQAEGTKNAYSAVLKPVEGTILTVAREAAEAAEKVSLNNNLTDTLLASYHQARKTLVKTSKVLPELRKQKMVDAGGWGLLIFLSAILKVMNIPTGKAEFNFKSRMNFFQSREDFQFANPYDMEFLVTAKSCVESEIRNLIKDSGTELITQTNGENCHVHIHTDNPLNIVEKVASLSSFLDLIIRDMRSQYYSMLDRNDGNLKYKAVAFGKSPGFLAMYAMAGAQVAVSINRLHKKKRLLQEYSSENALLISSENLTLPFPHEAVVTVDEEIKVLASLVSVYSSEKPSPNVVKEAADYPRIAQLIKKNNHFEAQIDGSAVYGGNYKESLLKAISMLNPQIGEVLTLYYDRINSRRALEEIIPTIQEQFPFLEMIDLYFGGQEIPLILSLE